MSSVTILIEKLKIIDCADDDEDMDLRLSVYVRDAKKKQRRVYSQKYDDVYVEEEGKVGNDSKCTFFKGVRIEYLANVEKVEVAVHLSSLDGDGFDWGGKHTHSKVISGLPAGRSDFNERKEHSDNSHGKGVYELEYSIVKE